MVRPLPERRVLDRDLHRPPPPADAGARRCFTAPRGSAPGSRTSPTCAAGVLAPSNAALVEMAVGLTGALGREVATQDQTQELLQLG